MGAEESLEALVEQARRRLADDWGVETQRLLDHLADRAQENERALHEIWEWACGIDLGDGSRRRLHETLQPLYERWGYGPFVDEVLAGVSAERGEQR